MFGTALETAVWYFQVTRPGVAAPVLDCRSSGGGQANPACLVTYQVATASIIVQAPSTALAAIEPGANYACAWGFVLAADSDYEGAGAAPLTFVAGVVEPDVADPIAPPTGSDDTVAGGANPTPSPVPPTLTNAIALTSASAAAAAASAAELEALYASMAPLPAAVAAIEGGTLSGTQAPNLVLASPNGASGPMTPRALVIADLPSGLIGGLTFLGIWNAATNSPHLSSGVGTNNSYYIVGTAGSTNLDGNSSWGVGAFAIFTGGAWSDVANVGAVTSVAGRAGAVVLSVGDVSVANPAAIAALTPSLVGSALISQGGRAGTFIWTAGNYETQVANDPGQGIFIAWSGDSAPGATGAWIRQYSGPV